MIISQFRNYSPINILFLSVVGFILCLGIFLHLPDKLDSVIFEPALGNLLGENNLINLSPSTNVFITLILTIFQATILNRITSHFNLLGKPSFLVALMYMTLASLFLPFLVLSPTLICNFISIWMLSKLLSLYRQTDVKAEMFDLGMIVGIGSLIYFPFLSMFFLLWIGLLSFRPFNWREWVTPLLGLATVYFILAVIYLWTGKMTQFYTIWLPFTYKFPTAIRIQLVDYLVLVPVIFTLILFLLVLKDNFFKSVVHIRKSFQLLFFMLCLAIVSFYWNKKLTEAHFLLCAPSIAIYMAYYFTYAKKKWFFEVVYAIITLTIIYFQFF